MNAKKIKFTIATMLMLVATACTSHTAEDDQVYEKSVDKTKIIIKG